MDDDRFRQWTRRGLAILAGSGMAAAFAFRELAGVGAHKSNIFRRNKRRRRRKKRRCNILRELCNPKPCCKPLQCEPTATPDSARFRCCKTEKESGAVHFVDECCSRAVYTFSDGHMECASCAGRTCDAEHPCCGGLDCKNGSCGGCKDRGGACVIDADCCFTACQQGICISPLGGRCARNEDCLTCRDNPSLCEDACSDGHCKV